MKRKLKIIGSWLLIIQSYGFVNYGLSCHGPVASRLAAMGGNFLLAILCLVLGIRCLRRSLETEESKQKKEQNRVDKIEATKKAQTATTYEWSIKKKK